MTKSKKILAGMIIAVAAILAVASSWNDSLVVDEVPHIGAAYSYVTKQDMRLNPEHPPLAKDLAGIPLLFLNLKKDVFKSNFWQKDVNGEWNFGRLLIFNSGNDPEQVKHFARLPMLLFFILSAVLIFKWARKLYGDSAAFIALILFAFSPSIIAHSRFVTTDMPALFGVFFATYFFLKYLKNQTHKNFLIAGVFLGIALVLKFSTVLLVPFFLLLAIIYGFADEQRKILQSISRAVFVFIISFVFVVLPIYYLNIFRYPPEKQERDSQSILMSIYGESYQKHSQVFDFVAKSSTNPVLRPFAWYTTGFLRVLGQAIAPHEVYFLGQINLRGVNSYFPIIYFLKEPLAWWGLILIAILSITIKFSISNFQFSKIISGIKNHLEEVSMILWVGIYWLASLYSNFNIGIRHLLPIYPFAILLVSGQLAKIGSGFQVLGFRKKLATYYLLLSIFLGWYIYESFSAYPYYLAYFNQIAGGPAGAYKYVVDSNLDWGQDLIRFSDWVKKNNIPKIEFDYFGWADPSYYLKDRYVWINSLKYKDALDFKQRNQSDGWLAVSATFLQTSPGSPENPKSPNYLWLHSFTPIAAIGHSIFVYQIK